jgi:hypothetical protein
MIFPSDDFKPCSQSDQVDENVENKVGSTDKQSVFEGVVGKVSEFVSTIHARMGKIVFDRHLHEREEYSKNGQDFQD